MNSSSGDHRTSEPTPAMVAVALPLRVAEARVEDIGHAVARVAPADLVRLGAQPGDVLKITGGTSAVARAELSDRTLMMAALRYPLMTAQVIGLIHLEAVKLRLAGVPYRRPGRDHRPLP